MKLARIPVSRSSFSAASARLLPMICGLTSDAVTSVSTERYLPSQPKRKLSAELKTVSVLSDSSAPSRPTSCRFVLAPFVPRSWHDEQLLELSTDKRASLNRRSPSLTFRGSIAGGAGMGVMGSSGLLAACGNNWDSARDGT